MTRVVPAILGQVSAKKEVPAERPHPISEATLLSNMKSDFGWNVIEKIVQKMIAEAEAKFLATVEDTPEYREARHRWKFYREFWSKLTNRIDNTVASGGRNKRSM